MKLFISAADVYFPLICFNLEGIDLMPRPTRTHFTDMDCFKASLIDAECCSRILNEKAMKQLKAWQPTWVPLFFFMLLETLTSETQPVLGFGYFLVFSTCFDKTNSGQRSEWNSNKAPGTNPGRGFAYSPWNCAGFLCVAPQSRYIGHCSISNYLLQ